MRVIDLNTFLEDERWFPNDLQKRIGESWEEASRLCNGSSIEDIWNLLVKNCLNSWFVEENERYNLEKVMGLIKYDIILSACISFNFAIIPQKNIGEFVIDVLKGDPDFKDEAILKQLIKTPNLKTDLGYKWSQRRKAILDTIDKAALLFLDTENNMIPTKELYIYVRQFSRYHLRADEEKEEYKFEYMNAELFYTLLKTRNRLPFTYIAQRGMYINKIYDEIYDCFSLLKNIYQDQGYSIEKIKDTFMIDNFLSFSTLDYLSTHYLERFTNLSTYKQSYSPEQAQSALYFYNFLFPLPYELCKSEVDGYNNAIDQFFQSDNCKCRWKILEPYISKYVFINSCLVPVIQTIFSKYLLMNENATLQNLEPSLQKVAIRLEKYILNNKDFSYYHDLVDNSVENERVKDYRRYLKHLSEDVGKIESTYSKDDKEKKGNKGGGYQKQLEFNIAYYFYFIRRDNFVEKCRRYADMDFSKIMERRPKVNRTFDEFIHQKIEEAMLEYGLIQRSNDFPKTKQYTDFIKGSKNRKIYPDLKK